MERPQPAAAFGEDGSQSPAPGGAVWRALIPLAVRNVPLVWAEGLYTNGGMAPKEVDRLMAAQVAGHRAVWLVASEVELWDERGLVEAWLAEPGELTDRRDLTRVSVHRYAVGE